MLKIRPGGEKDGHSRPGATERAVVKIFRGKKPLVKQMFVCYNILIEKILSPRGRREAGMGVHDGHRNRKREQFARHGIDAFADHEVLELLLYYAIPRRDVNPIAHALLDRFGSLEGVFSAPAEELELVPGVGKNAALLVALVPQVYRRVRQSAAREQILDTTERMGAFFLEQFVAQSQEVMYQLCLDAKGRMLNCRKVSEGDVASVGLNLRRIVENALRCNAVMVALAHNHPSGVALPSREDRVATIQIRDALEAVHVRLVDHIIVADDDFVSMRQDGTL